MIHHQEYTQILIRHETINKNGEKEVICPFCGKNNITIPCEHFMKKWSSPYIVHYTGEKLVKDAYYFISKVNKNQFI